jgi:hypothetical protein
MRQFGEQVFIWKSTVEWERGAFKKLHIFIQV